jgi:hypothetical protein
LQRISWDTTLAFQKWLNANEAKVVCLE